MSGNLIIISSPSGGGKGTLIREILATVPHIGYSISLTTRARRDGEVNGRDYHFVSKDEFEEFRQKGGFLEFAEVHGNFYGTSLEQTRLITAEGRDVILEIDVQGAEAVMAKVPEAISIFILPPSFAALKERLTGRATETGDQISLRLKNSRYEVSRYEKFQYVVVNDNVADAARRLESIILAERQRTIRQTGAIQAILNSFEAAAGRSNGESI